MICCQHLWPSYERCLFRFSLLIITTSCNYMIKCLRMNVCCNKLSTAKRHNILSWHCYKSDNFSIINCCCCYYPLRSIFFFFAKICCYAVIFKQLPGLLDKTGFVDATDFLSCLASGHKAA